MNSDLCIEEPSTGSFSCGVADEHYYKYITTEQVYFIAEHFKLNTQN